MVVKKGDKVAVEYEGRFEDGEVFDSSSHGDHSHPLIFEAGSGHVVPGFDNAVLGMAQNEEKEVTIEPKEGYGEYDENLKRQVPKSEIKLPRNQQPKAGMTLMMQTPDGQTIPLHITDVSDNSVTLDLNHPLAGKKLIFKLKVVGINETVPEEHHH